MKALFNVYNLKNILNNFKNYSNNCVNFLKFCIILLCFFAISCSSTNKKYCISGDVFDIEITGGSLSRVSQKLLLDSIINNSSINIDEDSNFLITLNIGTVRRTSLVSMNNDIENQNVDYIVKYKITDKINKGIIESGKLIITDDINISDDRFANFATENYITENFVRNLSMRLENVIKSVLANKKCKKNQNQVAFYYFNANINLRNTEGSYYV